MLARTESCKVCGVDSNDSARSLSDRRCAPVEYRRGKNSLFSGREKEGALRRETKRAKLESRRSNRSLLTRFPIANYASSTTNNKQRRCCAPLILVTSYLSSTREYFVARALRNSSLLLLDILLTVPFLIPPIASPSSFSLSLYCRWKGRKFRLDDTSRGHKPRT